VDLPLALALGLLATALSLTVLLHAAPRLAPWLARAHGAPGMSAAAVERGAAHMRQEGLAAIATTAAAALLLALCRARRPPERLLTMAAVALLAADLWHYGHGLVRTLPAAIYREPPPLARALAGTGMRIYAQPPPEGRPELMLRLPEPGLALVQAQLARLDPHAGALWRVPYALNEDYDLMLTRPADLALELLHQELKRPGLAQRLLGAWNVGTILQRRPPEEWIAEAARGGPFEPATAIPNPHVLPRYRLIPRASFHPTAASALGAAREQLYALDRGEHYVRPEGPPETLAFPGRPRLLEVVDRGGRIAVRYRSATPAFFTAAITHDRGWRADLDGRPLPIYPNAIGQLGLAVPAGEHRLRLTYRDPWLLPGALLSLASLAAILWIATRAGAWQTDRSSRTDMDKAEHFVEEPTHREEGGSYGKEAQSS
jgi:hypothetical protein